MANIVLVSGTGGLANRWGKIAGGQNEIQADHNATLNNRVGAITGLYQNEDNNLVQPLYTAQTAYQPTGNQLMSTYQSLWQSTLLQMENDAAPLNPNTQNVALSTLNNQLISGNYGWQKPTVAYTGTAASTNSGTAVLSASLYNQYGVLLDYLYAETINIAITSDSYTGGATAFQEPVQALGAPFVSELTYNWPQGSGANQSFNITNGNGSTLVANGGFETWPSASVAPSGWTITTGTIASNVVRSGNYFTGQYSLSFVGDGSTIFDINQPVTGIKPLTVYAFSMWLNLSASATGTLRVRLTSPQGTVTTNYSGANNLQTISMGSVSSTSNVWTNFSGFFQTPYVIPTAGINFEIDFSTVLQSGKTLYLDNVSLVAATQLYAGGPFAQIAAGAIASYLGDTWTLQVSTTGTTSTFVRNLDRNYQLRQLGIQLNSVTAGYIPDSLIS